MIGEASIGIILEENFRWYTSKKLKKLNMQEHLLSLDTAILANRTVIRRFRENDGKPLYDFVQDNWGWMHDYVRVPFLSINSVTNAEVFCQEKLSDWLLQKSYHFGVWDKKSAQLIGYIALFDIDWKLPHSSIRFLINKESNGKGMLKEALEVIIDFAFHQLLLEKLYFTTLMDDYDGQRMIRQFGFGREGDLRGAFRIQTGEIIDLVMFGKSKLEYV